MFNLGTGKYYSFNHVIDLLNIKLGTSLKSEYRETPIQNYVKDTQAETSKMKELGVWGQVASGKGDRADHEARTRAALTFRPLWF